jgi:hypothetical protein
MVPRVLATLRGSLALQGVEIDRTYGGLVPGSPPAVGAILSFYTAHAEDARELARRLEADGGAALTAGSAANVPSPHIVAAHVIDFDLEKTWR